jgi:hypothetical protein
MPVWLLAMTVVGCASTTPNTTTTPVEKPEAPAAVDRVPSRLELVRAEVSDEPVSYTTMRGDIPVVTVASADSLIVGVPATIHIEVSAPATMVGNPTDASYEGFNPEYRNRLSTESAAAIIEDKTLTATEKGGDAGAIWSPMKLSFDVRFTPTAKSSRLPMVGHLRFVLNNRGTCTMHAVKIAWMVAVAGTNAARGAEAVPQP